MGRTSTTGRCLIKGLRCVSYSGPASASYRPRPDRHSGRRGRAFPCKPLHAPLTKARGRAAGEGAEDVCRSPRFKQPGGPRGRGRWSYRPDPCISPQVSSKSCTAPERCPDPGRFLVRISFGAKPFGQPGTRMAVGKSPGGFQGRPRDILDLLWYRPKERGFFKL